MTEKSETMQFGIHLMIDGYDSPKKLLSDPVLLKKMLDTIPENMGMHAISESVVVEVGPKNKKDPGGLSGFVMIAESHLSFHTFPNRGFVTIDVYTCQNDLDTDKLANELKTAFQMKDFDVIIQKRGLRYPSTDIHN